MLFLLRLFGIDRFAFHVDLALEELVELFEHRFLAVRYLVLLLVKADSVWLATRLVEVPLVVVGAAAPPASIHQLLVVAHCHLRRRDAPGLVPSRLLLPIAVAAMAAVVVVSVAPVDIQVGQGF